MTNRILKALDNQYVRVLGHPSGRLINERNPYEFDAEKIIEKAVDKGIALEVNAFPNRLDLHDVYIRNVVERTV